MVAQKENKPYGLWPSPISASMVSSRLRLEDVQWDSDGRSLLWSEGRSDRSFLVFRPENDAPRDLTEEHNLHGGVGYGGGEFTVSNGIIIFTDRNGRLYRRSLGQDQSFPITPEFGGSASPIISPDGDWVAYVHTAERRDSIALVDSKGANWPTKLVQGSDFYMQPTWHPDSRRLAWIEWSHPQMPWDGTRLVLGRLKSNTPELEESQLIAGDEDTPVFQPAFSPDGRWLSYITGEGEWEKLVILDLESGERRVLADGAVFSRPAWTQGVRTYGWSPSSRGIFYLRNDAGFTSLWQVDLEKGENIQLDSGPYTWFSQLAVSPAEDCLAMIVSAPVVPTRIITWKRMNSNELYNKGVISIVKRSEGENIDPANLSIPQPLSWQSKERETIHGLYYPPTNQYFQGTGLPPAIIYIHGGPTSQSQASYSAETNFFTSRGYACLMVNYRGSTGYGRAYMQALRGLWGELDVEDAVSGAKALVDQGLADGDRLVIRGGSAGGYTVLNALIRYPGQFKAGLCSYGVSNLFTLAMDTHKFEERYTDSLVGPLPEASKKYHDWSPIFHADRIQDALAVFQGSDDKVVPPDQSESMIKALRARNIPHIYRLYPGEGHGFRKTETIQAYFADLERFLLQFVIFGCQG